MSASIVQSIFDPYNGLHHAYCIEGGLADIEVLEILLEKHVGVVSRGNPDFSVERFDTFGIDEARSLKERQSQRALVNKKIFIIFVDMFTREAQNSLLKVFEEPAEETYFFIFLPSAETLLPTLRSRLQIIKKNDSGREIQEEIKKEISKFIKSSKPVRLEIVKKMAEDKDRPAAINFLNKLEEYLYYTAALKGYEDFLKELYIMKSYLNDRSSSVKMILEHIALSLPQ
jgi:DNA polymerase III delta prime subunit